MKVLEKTEKCHICEQVFPHYDLKAHFLECDQQYTCDICENVFQTANLLKNHIAVHNGSKISKIVVENPNKGLIQSGQRKHKCKPCGKSFSHAGNLKKHIHTVHEGHKDYKCENCGKPFSQASNLKIHIHTVHEGHKDHKC